MSRPIEMEPPNSQPQVPQPLPSRARLVKPMWRVLMICNLALGAYMFSRVKKKNSAAEESKAPKPPVEVNVKETEEVSAAKDVDPYSDPYESIPEEFFTPPVSSEPTKVGEPISEDQQRQLFEWILEEKRKIMPKDREEKKRIDEDKAILKRFIRANPIPRI